MTIHTSGADRGQAGENPRYRLVADALRQDIQNGVPAPGEALPTQQQLMRRFGCSRGTVQTALQLLREEGLLEAGVSGRGARVARQAAIGRPLVHYVSRAFEAPHVSLDVWSLHTEELSRVVQEQAELIRLGDRPAPQSIRVRVLVPDLDTHHPYPRHVEDPLDLRPLRRLRRVVRMYAEALHHSLTQLAEEGKVASVSVEIRGLPTVPGEKRYLINGTQMLTGYYSLRTTRILVDDASIEVLELHSDTLFPAALEGNGARSLERAEFQQVQAWFNSRWDMVAQPLRLLDD
ncbi:MULTISPECIES: winged helix-turn-helix domain-containing protein [unclassified Streptomyces]|uniref:winged helix-turn-helix domain-containing protein n=1 Tax=unclassified Streptomyces TaxID=2593676 RepID=UPI002E37857D|nr:winged helix-turn-helix domain-containing protein [Streptomyces sp. NBC_01431]